MKLPLLNSSLPDTVFDLELSTAVEALNDAFEAAAPGALAPILGHEIGQLVSVDYGNDPRSSIVDGGPGVSDYNENCQGVLTRDSIRTKLALNNQRF